MPDSFSTNLKSSIQRLIEAGSVNAARSVSEYYPLYSNIEFAGDSPSETPEHPIICGLTECRLRTVGPDTVLPDDIQRCR